MYIINKINTQKSAQIFELYLLEEDTVRPDVPLLGGDEVLPGVGDVLHSDHVRVLHVDSVLDQHLAFLTINHEGGGVILSYIRVRCAVDTLTGEYC